MKKQLIGWISAVMLIAAAVATVVGRQAHESQRREIVVTMAPLAVIVRMIAPAGIAVYTLVPADTEPHHFEPTLADRVRAEEGLLFVSMGDGEDAWASKLRSADGTGHVAFAAGQPPVAGGHGWLDPARADAMAQTVARRLAERDRGDNAVIMAAAARASAVFGRIDRAYRDGLRSCRHRVVVTSHNGFAVLGEKYGFRVVALQGGDHDAEPSLRTMDDAAALIRREGIGFVLDDGSISAKSLARLVEQTGVSVLPLSPMERLGPQVDEAGVYESVARRNLASLSRAMECHP